MKRVLSLFIAAIIVCIALPVTASAENVFEVTNATSSINVGSGTTRVTSNGTVTLLGGITVNVAAGAEVIWEANVTGTHKVTFAGDGTTTITGRIENTSGTAVSVEGGTVTINGGTITGATGIDCLDGTITINSGTITATGGGGDAAVDITEGNDPEVTIGGTAVINGGPTKGVRIGNTKARLLITNGTISGETALYSSGFGSLEITGGSFSSTGVYQGIYSGVTQAMTIAPTATTPVTVRGNEAIKYYNDTGNPTLNNVFYYYASDDFDGTGKTLYDNSVDEFTFPSDYKYVEFYAVNPEPPIEAEPEKPDTSTPPHLVTSNIPDGYKPVFPTITPIYEHSLNIDVIAIINKSGSVDSGKTRIEIIKAARTPDVTQITLILPEGCKGISAAAIKRSLAAAGNKKLFLSYDDTTIRVTAKTGQVLTKLYYNA